jgi:hypothetical protein
MCRGESGDWAEASCGVARVEEANVGSDPKITARCPVDNDREYLCGTT